MYKRQKENDIFSHERLVVCCPGWAMWNLAHVDTLVSITVWIFHGLLLFCALFYLCTEGLKQGWMGGREELCQISGKRTSMKLGLFKSAASHQEVTAAGWKSESLSSLIITADMTRRQKESMRSTCGYMGSSHKTLLVKVEDWLRWNAGGVVKQSKFYVIQQFWATLKFTLRNCRALMRRPAEKLNHELDTGVPTRVFYFIFISCLHVWI